MDLVSVTVMICTVIVAAIAVVLMTVMVTTGVGIIGKRTFHQCPGGSIRLALYARIELNPRIGKRHLRAHAYASADQRVHLGSPKESGKGSMTAAQSIYHLFLHNFAVFNIVDFELLRVSEMLENCSVIIGNCDSHGMAPFQ